jgi:Zn finger protein HypA/HybF involved in hydrogenase expression
VNVPDAVVVWFVLEKKCPKCGGRNGMVAADNSANVKYTQIEVNG